jgi:hypothetical protein
MTFKIRLIAAGLGASLLAAASIAAAQTTGQTTQGTDQQASDPRAQVTALFTRMAEQCTRLMGRIAQ